MLRNLNILAGMDVSYAVDCGYTLIQPGNKCIHSRPHNLRPSLIGYSNYVTLYILLYI